MLLVRSSKVVAGSPVMKQVLGSRFYLSRFFKGYHQIYCKNDYC